MSRKFYAVNRETGDRWTPNPKSPDDYLMMYDSGYLAVVSFDGFYTHVTKLDPSIWKMEHRFKTVMSDQFDAMKSAMQTFVDRCEKGEVRSSTTYQQFKTILNDQGDNHV